MNDLQNLADLALELEDSASSEGCEADLMVVGSVQLWNLLQEVKRLKSMPEGSANQPTWQPIETAPKDRPILGFDPCMNAPFVMNWNVPAQQFVATYGMGDEAPSHWLGMPQLPSNNRSNK